MGDVSMWFQQLQDWRQGRMEILEIGDSCLFYEFLLSMLLLSRLDYLPPYNSPDLLPVQ